MGNSYALSLPAERLRALKILAACAVVIVIADLGVLSGFDAILAAIILAVISPALSPYLLLVIASIQDAPGLAGIAWYAGVVIVGAIFIIYAYFAYAFRFLKGSVNTWGWAASLVILFALAVSIANQYLGGHNQASGRNPFVVAGLMMFMTWLGIIYGRAIAQGYINRFPLAWLIGLLLVHGITIAIGQILIDPSFMTSAHGMVEIEEAGQMSMESALGIPRIHGTFLTPNAFALCIILLIVLLRALHHERAYGTGFLIFWILVGSFLSLASLSKAIGIVCILTSLFTLQRLVEWRLFFIAIGLVALFAVKLFVSEMGDDLASAFRITNELGGDSYRAQAWGLVLEKFTWADWLFGTGLAYWPVFFDKYMGVPLSDPHSWVLSLPGTFGLIGLAFFLVVLGYLSVIALRRSGNLQFAAFSMLIIFAVKDMFSISYLLGNTPLTFLIWLILATIWSKESRTANTA